MNKAREEVQGSPSRLQLIRAVIAGVADLGIDRISASDVIKRAGVSRPTFYSYFDDISGLLAETWIEFGSPWFEALGRGEHPAVDGEVHLALTEILLIAPRVSELLEVVQPDLLNMWTSVEKQSEVALVRYCWCLGLAIGVETARFVLPDASSIQAIGPIVAGMPNDWVGRQVLREVRIEGIPQVSEADAVADDEILTRLLDASIDVVIRAGVERASLSRICRAARLTTGAARPRFPSLHELVIQGFDRMIASVVSENMSEYGTARMGTRPWDAFAAFTISGLQPSRTRWRRYRQELHVAARVDSGLKQHLRSSFESSNRALATSLIELSIDPVGVELSILLNHVLALGFGSLSALGLDVVNVNHFTATDWLEDQTGLTMDK